MSIPLCSLDIPAGNRVYIPSSIWFISDIIQAVLPVRRRPSGAQLGAHFDPLLSLAKSICTNKARAGTLVCGQLHCVLIDKCTSRNA